MSLICSDATQIPRLKPSERLWLGLDYDGTLADFAPNPDVVSPDADLISLLTRLAQQPDLHLAVISGRRISHIRSLVPVPGIWLGGTYGIELLTPAGERQDRLDYSRIRPPLEALKPAWQKLITRQPQIYLEDKGWSMALHARYASDEEANRILASARKLAEPAAAGELHLLGNRKFLEIAPRAIDKGETMRYLMEVDPFLSARPVYVGDDDRDERAFAAVAELGGIGILVAAQDQPSTARCRLESPQAVRQWLREMIETRRSPQG
jgi:trehalose 6-phosphate phosphatase